MAVRNLPNEHKLLSENGQWVTDDGRYRIESDYTTTVCDGENSRSGYCPGHGYNCKGEKEVLLWTIWDVEADDHYPRGTPYNYETFTEALNALREVYQHGG